MTEEFSQHEVVRSFAAGWARATLRQGKQYRAAVDDAKRLFSRHDRLDDRGRSGPSWPKLWKTPGPKGIFSS